MSQDVEMKIREIIAELAMLEVAEVQTDTSLASLGVDSMALVETIFAIEETFDIQVPFNANDPSQNTFDVSTVGAIVAGVHTLIRQQT